MATSTDLSQQLNPQQLKAVRCSSDQNTLVLAGAGSGKTGTLVQRIAYLISEHKVDASHILAVTFTNKAAAEMRRRIESLVPNSGHIWLGTFHNVAHRLLRRHHQAAGLNDIFQIIDSEDQLRLLKRVIRQMGIDDKVWTPQEAQRFICRQKEDGIRPDQIAKQQDLKVAQLTEIYRQYETVCRQGDLVDFSELLLRCYEMLKNNAELLQHYQNRFQHILIDEFQDTNTIQYLWMKLLYKKGSAMMVVGDDDQSIYGWRGAKIENIQTFQQDFDAVKVIKLEQNYRSTQVILDAANALIDHNSQRLGKQLWTEQKDGGLIKCYQAFNEVDESTHIARQIEKSKKSGRRLQQMAILYRSNAQSRVIEETLLRFNTPYQVYGGMRFFARAEIKDALAYLRLVQNPHDNASFDRIINVPTRGIGSRTQLDIREVANQKGISYFEASQQTVKNKQLSTKAQSSVTRFIHLIEQLQTTIKDLQLAEQIKAMLSQTQLMDHYDKMPGEKGKIKVDNLKELINAGSSYTPLFPEANQTVLQCFLTDTSLDTGDTQAQDQDSVQLMTIHAAKGLEFEEVFLTGMEDELFPPRFATMTDQRLEEERRLCYVAMTRAKQQLHISHAQVRRVFGDSRTHSPSRFLAEIPAQLMEQQQGKREISRPGSYLGNRTITNSQAKLKPTKIIDKWQIGQQVKHPRFGAGVITNYEGNGKDLKLQINFKQQGPKWLIAELAKIEAD